LREEIVKQLPEVPKRQILAEPAQRNTAPAIALAAHILHAQDPNAVMGVFPSDHVIARPGEYTKLARAAFKSAAEGNLVVLGIKPRWAETGYGYIEFPEDVSAAERRARRVISFREKPDAATAERFVGAGNFYWNAGMFFWKTSVLLDALRRFLPKTEHLLAGLPPFGSRKFAEKLAVTFPECDNISIDYAVLERASNVAGIPAGDIGWNDVGSWNAVYELHKRDAEGNALRAPALIEKSTGNYVDAEGKLIALLGVKDLIVVDTPDALLIADRSRAQEVGELVRRIEKSGRTDLL
jgi:mannose-1-phosphate guanylyltransferase